MRGDFSAWNKDRSHNFRGTLHQQGRVLLDRDWNAQTEIIGEWQETAARDAFGAGVAAVPDEEPLGFKVVKAEVSGSEIKVSLNKGRVWADGLIVELSKDAEPPAPPTGVDAVRIATYLSSPIQNPPALPVNGDLDAVILETWIEELSPFQNPDLLLEPALGGVDTTERVQTAFRIRLYRKKDGDTCDSLISKLRDDFSKKGRLTVELNPTVVSDGDCPLVESGGFTGFEHRLYRIEIADVDPANHEGSYFKWSHFNGGLVGTGNFNFGTQKVELIGNMNAVLYSGLDSFYLEALNYNSQLGCWEIVYGGNATLKDSGLDLSPGDIFKIAASAPKDGPYFFRLWNGIERVNNFTSKQELPDGLGILIQFEQELPGKYTPSDFWTFEVRAGGIGNPPVPVGDAEKIALKAPVSDAGYPPQGIFYHRVPLAILNWADNTAKEDDIQDCRRIFDPLTDQRNCCIAVKPGEDIQSALMKIVDTGGCICLLPGEHVLTNAIDLSGRSSISIRGAGSASLLIVSSRIKGQAPFILTNTHDITFESFAVVNQSPSMLFFCGNTVGLRVENVTVLTGLTDNAQPVFALKGSSYGWRVVNNVFVGATGLSGRLLASSDILDNIWIGARCGINLTFAQELQIERNEFVGIHTDHMKEFDALTGDMASGVTPLSSRKKLTQGVLRAPNAETAPSYNGIEINGAFDVDIIDNDFFSAVGLYIEWTENCVIQRNCFRTPVAGTVCGIAHGFHFDTNRIGVNDNDEIVRKPIACEAGLVLLADAVECRITNNSFANVKQGVVFEPDPGSKKTIMRDFSANLFTLGEATRDASKKALMEAEGRARETFEKSLLLSSSFFGVATSKRVVIEGNQFHAAETGIEWSGTTQIYDFRIAGNAFIGCQDVAIQIEADARMLLLAEPVDTKVRLIENNRFEIYSGAVRATVGSVRVEKNDIRIDTPGSKKVPQKEVLKMAANDIYNSPLMAKAAESEDFPLVSMMAMEAMSVVDKNPGVANARGFAKHAGENILKTYQPQRGDALADKVFVTKTVAELGANEYLGVLVNAMLPKWTFNSAGFVINLAGTQNRVVHNRLYGNNAQRPGGVLYNAVSGEVRDNEIVVPGTALMLNGKVGLASGYNGAEVRGNSLASVGVAGSKTAVYALAIPSLSPGNLAINDNLFKGSVMIGGDPLSAQGFNNDNVVAFPKTLTFYNVMKLDMATYGASLIAKAFPMQFSNFGIFRPPIVQTWLSDPHANRPVVHFCQNRVIQGWVGIFQALSGAYWSAERLKKQAGQALIANIANNVIDYGGSIVGHELVITGNHSQRAIKYRSGGSESAQALANIPPSVIF